MIKIYRSTDFAVMPWKNKRGSTTQFLLEPAQAQFPADTFSWRFSSAPIITDGEFSIFPGYLRALMVIEGSGLELNQVLLKPGEAHYFSGDETTKAILTAGPIRDLGIIYLATRFRVQLDTLQLNARQTLTLAFTDSETILLYALRGSGIIGGDEMHEGEIARIENTRVIRLQASGQPVVWVKVRIEKIEF